MHSGPSTHTVPLPPPPHPLTPPYPVHTHTHTDKARDFGAGPLFNQILPLLMSPTLEDQERHLLVKVCVLGGAGRGGAKRSGAEREIGSQKQSAIYAKK
jgi:hypothetical protein